MEVKPNRLLILLTGLWLALATLIGVWWLYYIIKLSDEVEKMMPGVVEQSAVIRMAKWEGGTFIILLLLTTVTVVYLYLKDIKKNQALGSFFASITHELKTPLASMRLQSEVIKETVDQIDLPNDRLSVLTNRLIEDAKKLEVEMDKLLQLSRTQRGGLLDIKEINLEEFFHDLKRKIPEDFTLDIRGLKDANVYMDEYAFSLCLKNLVENTMRHTKEKSAVVTIQKEKQDIVLTYLDTPDSFEGDVSKLGELFYKGPKSKGSGIGLYLVKVLIKQMRGRVSIKASPSLSIEMILKDASHD